MHVERLVVLRLIVVVGVVGDWQRLLWVLEVHWLALWWQVTWRGWIIIRHVVELWVIVERGRVRRRRRRRLEDVIVWVLQHRGMLEIGTLVVEIFRLLLLLP